MPLIPYAKALAEIGLSRTAGYAQVGITVTAPILVGYNKTVMPSAEVEVQRLARVAGFTKAELQELVGKLTAARQDLASDEQVLDILRAMQVARLARGTQSDYAARSATGRKRVAQRWGEPA